LEALLALRSRSQRCGRRKDHCGRKPMRYVVVAMHTRKGSNAARFKMLTEKPVLRFKSDASDEVIRGHRNVSLSTLTLRGLIDIPYRGGMSSRRREPHPHLHDPDVRKRREEAARP